MPLLGAAEWPRRAPWLGIFGLLARKGWVGWTVRLATPAQIRRLFKAIAARVRFEPFMNWSDTRRKLYSIATGQIPAAEGKDSPSAALPAEARTEAPYIPTPESPAEKGHTAPARARSICVASGKGGTGKSVISASLAAFLAERARTLIVDADLGVGNAHILQDVAPPASFVDVVEGRLDVHEALVTCRDRLDLLAGGSGVPRMAGLSSYELHLIASGLEQIESDYGYLVVDSAAGLSRQTLQFAQNSELVLVVTTPDLTAMTDAYAFMKVVTANQPRLRPRLVVNRALSEEEAHVVAERTAKVCERFLSFVPELVGWIPDDPAVTRCVNHRAAVCRQEPESSAGQALRRLGERLLSELGPESVHGHGLGQSLRAALGYSGGLG